MMSKYRAVLAWKVWPYDPITFDSSRNIYYGGVQAGLTGMVLCSPLPPECA
jgi:hypothetical protein